MLNFLNELLNTHQTSTTGFDKTDEQKAAEFRQAILDMPTKDILILMQHCKSFFKLRR